MYNCETLFDLPGKQSRAQEINELMAAPGFWDDQEKAQGLVGELRRLTLTIKPLTELVEGYDDMGVLKEFAEGCRRRWKPNCRPWNCRR